MKIPGVFRFPENAGYFCRDGYQPSVTPDFNKYPDERTHHL